MENQQHPAFLTQHGQQMLHDLAQLRVALTHLALLLHDLEFEVNTDRRQDAARQTADCMARCQAPAD